MEQVFSYQHLYEFSRNVFLAMGSSEANAQTAAKVLLSADMRGVDSHGIARLSGYIRLWETGRINANPGIRVVHETPSTAVVDGDKGLGLVVAPAAMEIAIEKEIKIVDVIKRFDIVVYDYNSKPWMIIECKEMKEALNEKVLQQVLRYNISLKVSFVVITNGTYCYGFTGTGANFSELENLPPYPART